MFAGKKSAQIREILISESAWEEMTCLFAPSLAKFLFLLIRRVRNNLFHGGKFNGKWFEPERSEALLQHGLVILRHCGTRHSEVSKAYSGIA